MAERKTTGKNDRKNILVKPYQPEYINRVLAILEKNGYNWNISSNTLKYCLFVDGKLVGFLEVSKALNEAEVYIIVIDPLYQGKGLGTLFLSKVLQELKETGVDKVFLEVSTKNNRAINLYTKLGFMEIFRRKSYYKDGSDAIIMEKIL